MHVYLSPLKPKYSNAISTVLHNKYTYNAHFFGKKTIKTYAFCIGLSWHLHPHPQITPSPSSKLVLFMMQTKILELLFKM